MINTYHINCKCCGRREVNENEFLRLISEQPEAPSRLQEKGQEYESRGMEGMAAELVFNTNCNRCSDLYQKVKADLQVRAIPLIAVEFN